MVQLPLHHSWTRLKLLHLKQRLSTFFWLRTTTSDLEDLTFNPCREPLRCTLNVMARRCQQNGIIKIKADQTRPPCGPAVTGSGSPGGVQAQLDTQGLDTDLVLQRLDRTTLRPRPTQHLPQNVSRNRVTRRLQTPTTRRVKLLLLLTRQGKPAPRNEAESFLWSFLVFVEKTLV